MPRPQEGYHHLDPEVIARNPPRFAELVHWTDTWGFEDNRGPVPWQDRESSNGGGGFVGGVAAVSVATNIAAIIWVAFFSRSDGDMIVAGRGRCSWGRTAA